MTRSLRMLMLLTVSAMLACDGVQAGPPSYLLLRHAEAATAEHPPVHPTSMPHEVHAQAYAYGWFGACPRQHAQRHFGYYRTYTQWSSW